MTNKQGLPLALRISAHRQFHGSRGMILEELAVLAGISVRQLAIYESRTDLPRGVDALIAIATALDTTVDALIAPKLKERHQKLVDARRHSLGLNRPTDAPVGFSTG